MGGVARPPLLSLLLLAWNGTGMGPLQVLWHGIILLIPNAQRNRLREAAAPFLINMWRLRLRAPSARLLAGGWGEGSECQVRWKELGSHGVEVGIFF